MKTGRAVSLFFSMLMLILSVAKVSSQTLPPAPGAVYLGTGTGATYWAQDTLITANWSDIVWPSPDADGREKRYEWAVKEISSGADPIFQTLENGTDNTLPPPNTIVDGVVHPTVSPLTDATSYVVIVRSVYRQASGALVYGLEISSSPFDVDLTPPTASVAPITIPSGSQQFDVQWSGTDSGSGVDFYDVEYSYEGGAWASWIAGTTAVSDVFTSTAMGTYSFRARATDAVGNQGAWSAPEAYLVNSFGPTLDITAAPTALSFPGGTDSLTATLNVGIVGSGNVAISGIQESRSYPDGSVTTGVIEPLGGTVYGGAPLLVTRTVSLSAIQRAKALTPANGGVFILAYEISGTDGQGNPLSSTVQIQSQVTESIISSLNVGLLEVILPNDPYYLNDQIPEVGVRVTAAGTGSVDFTLSLLDDSNNPVPWSGSGAYTATVTGTTLVTVPQPLPTSAAGSFLVKAQLTSPDLLAAETGFDVIDTQSPIGASGTIMLIPGVAELQNLNATDLVLAQSGYTQHVLYGSGDLVLHSLGGTIIQGATIPQSQSLVIRYYDTDPATPVIVSGFVEVEADPNDPTPLVTAADGSLKIRRLSFTGSGDPANPTTVLSADAALVWTHTGEELCLIPGVPVGQQGVEAANIMLDPSAGVSINLFGQEFGVEGISIAADAGTGDYSYTMEGSVSWRKKLAGVTQPQELAIGSYTGLTVDSNGTIAADTPLQELPLIPGTMFIDHLSISGSGGSTALVYEYRVAGLPFPAENFADRGELTFLADGTFETPAPLLNELATGGGLDNGQDGTEWAHEVAVVDLTYVRPDLFVSQGALFLEHSRLAIGLDVYLELGGSGGSAVQDADKRVRFGALDSTGLVDGIEIAMDGEVFWPAPTEGSTFTDKRLDVNQVLTLELDTVAVVSDPFRFNAMGTIVLDLPGVGGGAEFADFLISLDGSIEKGSTEEIDGQFDFLSVVQVIVGDIDWGGAGTIEFDVDESTGSGSNRSFAKGSKQVAVEDYFRLEGAEIQLGDSGASGESMFGGSFDSMTVFKPVGENKSFVVENIEASFPMVELKNTDMEYLSTFMRFSGTVKIEAKDIIADVVGKAGVENGKATFGLFVAARNLNINVYPSVYLDEIGGGIFLNPSEDDLALVREMARFEKPELGMVENIDAMLPDGAGDPGSFALMLLGGVYVVSKNTLQGRAMLTITANRVELDAEAKALKGILEGKLHLTVSWNPGYAWGMASVDLNAIKILTGNGTLEFYVFDASTWGISGAFNIGLNLGIIQADLVSGNLFLGPPGFLVDISTGFSLDIGFVSGGFSFEAMFWYHNRQDQEDTWGAYAAVEVYGEILWGLISGRAKLEGALIGAPEFLVYAVGYLKVKICWVTVFEGSLWVSVGENGIHGGTGRNSAYDQLIEDAKNMASEMNQAKDELLADLGEVMDALNALDAEQINAAGSVLVERSGLGDILVQLNFDLYETARWDQGPPAPLSEVYQALFEDGQNDIVQARTDLNGLRFAVSQAINDIEAIQQEVSSLLDLYDGLITESLPPVQSLSAISNPFQGYQTATVQVAGETMTVRIGFTINEQKDSNQINNLTSIRSDFAQYQEAFIRQAGVIDGKLRIIDDILFNGQYTLSQLNDTYAEAFDTMGSYAERFVRFQRESAEAADTVIPLLESASTEAQARAVLQQKADELGSSDPTALYDWIVERHDLINALLVTGGQSPANLIIDSQDIPALKTEFVNRGLQLWVEIPLAGFTTSRDEADTRAAQVITSYSSGSASFRSQWSAASETADDVFERKSDLYDILWEIYDQLTYYGSGMIGITSDGNAAGFPGLAAAGLAFRSASAATDSARQGTALPETFVPTKSPTMGPNNPPARKPSPAARNPLPNVSSDKDAVDTSPIAANFQTTPYIAAGGTQQSSAQLTLPLVSSEEYSLAIDTSQIRAYSPPSGARYYSEFNRTTSTEPPTSWVPIRSYFSWKRDEVVPFLEIPSIDSYMGSLLSNNQDTAVVSATMSASHPIGVVEYSYRLVPVASGGGGSGSGIGLMLIPLSFGNPTWYSLGSHSSLSIPFFEGYQSGTYDLYLRARGAGGRTIFRKGTIVIDYFDPAQDGAPIGTQMQSGDSTPPTTPVVTTAGPFTNRQDVLYGEWSSSDPESGIGGYEYGVQTHDDAEAAGGKNLQPSGVSTTGAVLSDPQGYSVSSTAVSIAQPDVVPWTSAQGRTEANIRNLSLQHGEFYNVAVRAQNGFGDTTVGFSPPILVDLTPPAPPSITSLLQVSADGHGNSISFNFADGTDPESGISSHEISLGSTEGSQDLLTWTETSAVGGIIADIPVMDMTSVFLNIRATNGAGTPATTSQSVVLTYSDISPATSPGVVTEPSGFTFSVDELFFTWNEASDTESGVVGYRYAVGSSPTDQDIVGWTSIARNNGAYLVGSSDPSATTERIDISGENDGKQQLGSDSKSAAKGGEFGVSYKELSMTSTTSRASYEGLESDYSFIEETPLTPTGEIYVQVIAINGAGLQTPVISGPIQIDGSEPVASIQADTDQHDRSVLTVHISAADTESGIESYKFGVWESGPIARAEDKNGRGALMIPVAFGVSTGVLSTVQQEAGEPVMESMGEWLAEDDLNLPLQVLEMALPAPWHGSEWIQVSNGANPESVEIDLEISGFPKRGLLAYDERYLVVVWTMNGAGVVTESNRINITLTRPPTPAQSKSSGAGRSSSRR